MKRISGGVVVPKYHIDHFSGVTATLAGFVEVTLSYKSKSIQHIVIQASWHGGWWDTEYFILEPVEMVSSKLLRIAVRFLMYDPTLLVLSRIQKHSVAIGAVLPPFNVFYEVAS